MRPEIHRPQAGHIAAQWHGFCHNPHVRTEFAALMLALLAFGSSLAGLHITPVVLGFIAIALVCGDLYDWVRDRPRN